MSNRTCRELMPACTLYSTIASNSQVMASTGSLIPLRAIDRTRTSSTTRFGDPFEERSSGNQIKQRSLSTGTSRQDEPSSSEEWEDEHANRGTDRPSRLSEHYHEERTNTAAVEHLLLSESTVHDGDRDGLRFPKNKDIGASRSDAIACVPTPCRNINALSTMGQAALDLCITATSVYFIAFAVMSLLHKGDKETSPTVEKLLYAARFVSPIYLLCS
jgi:hypothetical protein